MGVAAALLVALGGNDITKANIKKLLDVVGIECDGEKVDLVVKELSGKNIEELLPKAPKSWPLCPQVVVVVLHPQRLLLAEPPLLKLKKKRKKRNPKQNLMMTWDSAFSINFLYFTFIM